MNTTTSYPHLTTDEDGTVRIGQTRYKVRHLAAEHYQHGWTAEELMRQHPDLRPEEVYAAMAYLYDHYESLMAEVQRSWEAVASTSLRPLVSHEELLRRATAGDPDS